MQSLASSYVCTQKTRRTRSSSRLMGNAAGITLIEAMVVVAILAILAALAGPAFTPLMQRWRVRQAAESLQSSLYLGRSEAIKRGGNVSIKSNCASATTDWSCGWTVFIDTNNNGAQDSGQTPAEDSLQMVSVPSNTQVTLTSSNGYLHIDRWGQFDNNGNKTAAFRLYPQGASTAHPAAETVCVKPGGQIKRMDGGSSTCP
ncbi:GspH/FimT family pseudopilin [Extensimonas perlucida]|uniref:GspH/FimT family pseudopilin n=1 Tax=Extensimonas perlucida TaxID=2590786 RepID=UPI001FE8CE86|nr:GspH/FimT family protein [Extensimonas perlucida]